MPADDVSKVDERWDALSLEIMDALRVEGIKLGPGALPLISATIARILARRAERERKGGGDAR